MDLGGTRGDAWTGHLLQRLSETHPFPSSESKGGPEGRKGARPAQTVALAHLHRLLSRLPPTPSLNTALVQTKPSVPWRGSASSLFVLLCLLRVENEFEMG